MLVIEETGRLSWEELFEHEVIVSGGDFYDDFGSAIH